MAGSRFQYPLRKFLIPSKVSSSCGVSVGGACSWADTRSKEMLTSNSARTVLGPRKPLKLYKRRANAGDSRRGKDLLQEIYSQVLNSGLG